MTDREFIREKKRWVVKVGSALLTSDGLGLNVALINQFASQLSFLRSKGVEVLLVSSGAVAAGMGQLGLVKRPEQIAELQAAAAVGQATLVGYYEQAFSKYAIKTAQVLLTHADIANRSRYLNARNTLIKLLALDVLTVVNENDSVATEEIQFGDNDNLAALVANLVGADLLLILTDQDGLFNANPDTDPNAELVGLAQADDPALRSMASGGSELGRGGMLTKLNAARIAAQSGATTIIANGRTDAIIEKLYLGQEFGTVLLAKRRINARKQWMAGQMKISGTVVLDAGASRVLKKAGGSLLPIGVTEIKGEFKRGELLSCLDTSGAEIARGLSNYTADEARKLLGKSSANIVEVLGYRGADELIHRDNLVVF